MSPKCCVTVRRFIKGFGFRTKGCVFQDRFYLVDGKWYCGLHHPIRVKEREESYQSALREARKFLEKEAK